MSKSFLPMTHNHTQAGFTLVEIVVVVILSIFAGMIRMWFMLSSQMVQRLMIYLIKRSR